MATMIITSVEVIPVRLPLREPFVIAYATYPNALSVLVRVRTRDGAEGWGEATPDPNVTGETWGGVVETIRRDLAPALLGLDARHREAALVALDARVEGAPSAKAALDIALHDLVARAAGIPLWQLLGGRARDALQISRVISIGTLDEMAAAATRHVAAGFQTVKVKVGDAANPMLDVQRVATVREAVGPGLAQSGRGHWRYPRHGAVATGVYRTAGPLVGHGRAGRGPPADRRRHHDRRGLPHRA
jgi:L-alanine-DL-glutamate epimerase-like enolase superfamily enzyme